MQSLMCEIRMIAITFYIELFQDKSLQFESIKLLDKKHMVTVKYNAKDDKISMSEMSIQNDIIERKFYNCLNWVPNYWDNFLTFLSRSRYNGMILLNK